MQVLSPMLFPPATRTRISLLSLRHLPSSFRPSGQFVQSPLQSWLTSRRSRWAPVSILNKICQTSRMVRTTPPLRVSLQPLSLSSRQPPNHPMRALTVVWMSGATSLAPFLRKTWCPQESAQGRILVLAPVSKMTRSALVTRLCGHPASLTSRSPQTPSLEASKSSSRHSPRRTKTSSATLSPPSRSPTA